MLKKVLGAFKYYNANSKDVRKGDCSVRAMSLAYGLEYDEVYHELKQMQKSSGTSLYNTLSNIHAYIKKHGGKALHDLVDADGDTLTVFEFAELHKSGTYLLLTSRSENSRIHHIIACIDGDIYDTWDSMDEWVQEVYMITDATTHLYSEDFDIVEAAKYIVQQLKDYIASQNSKTNIVQLSLQKATAENNDTIIIELNCDIEGDVPAYSKYANRTRVRQKFVAKFNLKKTQEENIALLIPKLRTKIYDWMYNIRKEVSDARKAVDALSDKFHGDRLLAMKLPDWCYPNLLYATSDGYVSKFEVDMEALPDDPRFKDVPTVKFYGDTLRELKQQILYYKSNFVRYGMDY